MRNRREYPYTPHRNLREGRHFADPTTGDLKKEHDKITQWCALCHWSKGFLVVNPIGLSESFCYHSLYNAHCAVCLSFIVKTTYNPLFSFLLDEKLVAKYYSYSRLVSLPP